MKTGGARPKKTCWTTGAGEEDVSKVRKHADVPSFILVKSLPNVTKKQRVRLRIRHFLLEKSTSIPEHSIPGVLPPFTTALSQADIALPSMSCNLSRITHPYA